MSRFAWILAWFATGVSADMMIETRDVANFHSVSLGGSHELTLSPGDFSVTVEADEDEMSSVETDVRGGVLHLGREASFFDWFSSPRSKIHFTVTMPNVERVSVSGSGHATVAGFSSDDDLALAVSGSGRLRVGDLTANDVDASVSGSGRIVMKDCTAGSIEARISGSGQVDLDGRTGEFAIDISGSGRMNALDMRANDVRVDISGSGSARVHAVEKLDVRIGGSGRVRYAGRPNVTKRVNRDSQVRPVAEG